MTKTKQFFKTKTYDFQKENRVIIRIWASEYNTQLMGQDVGHISIEMTNYYASLWPAGKKNILATSSAAYPEKYHCEGKNTNQEFCCDFHLEKRKPELTVCLYSLHIGNMEDKFVELKNDTRNWNILGNNLLINKHEESCASLAWKILCAGGLNASTSEKSSYSSIVAPDFMVYTLLKAKFNEIEKCENVKNFTYSNETTILKLQQLYAKCNQQSAPAKKLSICSIC